MQYAVICFCECYSMGDLQKDFGVAGDPFGKISGAYRDFRPTYPDELITFLSQIVPDKGLAWDCATGTGQVAAELAKHFRRVVATDISPSQLAAAISVPNVDYIVCPAEKSGLKDNSVDLITVAQALHWFKLDDFFNEAKRVLSSHGLLAIWTYGPLTVEGDRADAIVQDFYYEKVGPYWPEGRQLVDSGYQDIQFPFIKELQSPPFHMQQEWSKSNLLGYLSTWSSVVKYQEAKSENPLLQLESQLSPVWSEQEKRKITWPLTIRVGSFEATK